jgi:hypothetical protein
MALDMPITLMPLRAGTSKEGKEQPNMAGPDLTAIVVATSIKILMEDGWHWLKSKVSSDSELISLNIAGIEVTPENTKAGMSTEVAQKIAPDIDHATYTELLGYNKRLDHLAEQKRGQLAELDRGATGVDRGRVRAEIAVLENEMNEVREAIFTLLKRHARINLITR